MERPAIMGGTGKDSLSKSLKKKTAGVKKHRHGAPASDSPGFRPGDSLLFQV